MVAQVKARTKKRATHQPPEVTVVVADEAQDEAQQSPDGDPQEAEEPQENPKVIAARAEVQTLLDRFEQHRFALNYEALVAMAERMILRTYVETGVLDRDEVAQRALGAQASILQQEFQARCIQRDEAALVKPRARANDRAAQVGRQVMMQRPRVIRPSEAASEASVDA